MSSPLPRVYLRLVWPPDRRCGHRQRLRSRASGPPGRAPAPPRGRASVGAARRLCGNMHVVFTRYCSALLTTRLTSHAAPLYASSRRSAAPPGALLQRGCAVHRGSRPKFRERRGLSVRLLHHDHRDAGGERAAPRIPARAPLATPKVGATARRRVLFLASSRALETGVISEACRTALATHRRGSEAGKLALQHGAATIVADVSSGQPGAAKSQAGGRRIGRSGNKLGSTRALQHRPP